MIQLNLLFIAIIVIPIDFQRTPFIDVYILARPKELVEEFERLGENRWWSADLREPRCYGSTRVHGKRLCRKVPEYNHMIVFLQRKPERFFCRYRAIELSVQTVCVC